MKIAFISDIHSNIFALKAVLDEVKDVDKIYCLGDIVGSLPFSGQTIEELKKNNIFSIAGDWDRAFSFESHLLTSRNDFSKNISNFKNLQKKLHESDRAYLSGLENYKRIKNEDYSVLMFHGFLDEVQVGLEDSSDEKKFLKVIKSADADVYVFGHIHRPYVKKIGSKIFINSGSIGKSKKLGLAEYALVDLNQKGLSVQILQASYDLDDMKKSFGESDF